MNKHNLYTFEKKIKNLNVEHTAYVRLNLYT